MAFLQTPASIPGLLDGRYTLVPSSPTLISCQNALPLLPVDNRLSDRPKVSRIGPYGWKQYINPEGQVYYHHAVDKITTISNIYSTEIRETLHYLHDYIHALAKQLGKPLPSTTEVFLDLDSSPPSKKCMYYLIDWDKRCGFWVDEVESKWLDMETALSPGQLELALLNHFWTHVEHFPIHKPMHNNAYIELTKVLAGEYACLVESSVLTFYIGQLGSKLKTTPLTDNQCEELLQMLSDFADSGTKLCIIARCWRMITHHQFLKYPKNPYTSRSRDYINKLVSRLRTRSPSPLLFLPPSCPEKTRILQPTTSTSILGAVPNELESRSSLPSGSLTSYSLPVGWLELVHPEGGTYFYHPVDRILTKCNVKSGTILSAILFWRDHIHARANIYGLRIPDNTEIVLDLEFSTKVDKCLYYLIDLDTKNEFWIGEDPFHILCLGICMATPSHLELALAEQFWAHNEIFPVHRPIPHNADHDLLEALNYMVFRQLLSESSTFPWTAAQCEVISRDIRGLNPGNDGVKTYTVARYWRTLKHAQLLNLNRHYRAGLHSILFRVTPLPRTRTLPSTMPSNGPEWRVDVIQLSYTEYLRKFMRLHWTGLKSISVAALLLILINVLTLKDNELYGHDLLALASMLFALISVTSATVLSHSGRRAVAYENLNSREMISPIKNQAFVIMASLPHSSLLWSLFTRTIAMLIRVRALGHSTVVLTSTLLTACAELFILALAWHLWKSSVKMPELLGAVASV